jgi:hypothetical protein
MGSRKVFVAAFCLLSSIAFSWNDAAHGAIVTLSYRHLSPDAKLVFDELLPVGVEAKFQSVSMAGVWADEFRDPVVNTGPWHYYNVHFRSDGRPSTLKPNSENVVWALARFRKTLADKSASKESRATALRWVLHLVADAHNPMHAVSRDDDRGGNDYPIDPGRILPRGNTNLHKVWDSGVGAFDITMRGGEPGFDDAVVRIAESIEAAHSFNSMSSTAKWLEPNDWIQEGFKLARDFAYTTPRGGVPSQSYVNQGQEHSLRLAALSAYRLVTILNTSLAGAQ